MPLLQGALPESVWRDNEAYIRRICAHKLSSHPDEIEDAVQETGLAFFEALKKGTEIREPKKWLTVVCSNVVNDTLKRLYADAKRLRPVDEEPVLSLPSPEETEPTDEAVLLQGKDAFLSSLTEGEAELFRLRFVKRKKLKAIAREMGITETNVKQRIFRLKQKAKKYAAEWADDQL